MNHKLIDRYAIEITTKLQEAGHTAYLVGGCVRDLLLGRSPKDFDISTTARPRQIKRVIRNSYIIGRRFKLVLAKKGDIQYEVSTFRRNLQPGENADHLPEGDNIFGSPEQDAYRRDYTCNALFYDPVKKIVIDHTGGIKDICDGWVKLIGQSEDRLPEDPIRILRAVRFAAKLNLQLTPYLKQGLEDHAEELKFSPIPRKREEYLKILRLMNPGETFLMMADLKILDQTLPELMDLLKTPDQFRQFVTFLNFFERSLRKTVDPGSLFGILVISLLQASKPEIKPEDCLDWIKQEEIQKFIKHELGAFNTELTHMEQAFRILPTLFDFESYERKGARKKASLLLQKALPLSLLFLSQLKGPDLCHWLEAYDNFDPDEELIYDDSSDNNDET